MRIKMIGIDFNKASLKERELFAFCGQQLQHSLENIYKNYPVCGCVIISTCNRTELWVSEVRDEDNDLIDIICSLKAVERAKYEGLFIKREQQAAILHLFETACGMRSQIIGEDQILSQVKASIELARKAGAADELLEKLFQTAVTSAKRIKSDVRITTADASVAYAAVVKAREHFEDVSGLKCLVIGNGEMGRLAAGLFIKNGAEVTITLRNHKNGINCIPEGCRTIDYDKRSQKIKDCDVIVSATISPHHTVQKSDVGYIPTLNKRFLFIDLAVPRDICEDINDFENATVINMDSIGISQAVDEKTIQRVSRIIDGYINQFHEWCLIRKYIKSVKGNVKYTSDKLIINLKKDIDKLNLNLSDRNNLENKILNVIEKAI